MPRKTPNHDLNLYEQGDDNWTHTPDMETIEERMWVRDVDDNRNTYEAHVDALFLATDTGDVYIGDGNSWGNPIGRISPSSDGDLTTEGIANVHDHVGAFHHGDLIHNPGTELWGVHFWAEAGLALDSVVLEFDEAASSEASATVELWEAEIDDSDGKNDSVAPTEVSSPVDSQTVSVTDGPSRHSLGFTIPSNGEYFLGVTGDVALRRADDWNGWNDYTRSDIDLMFGGRFNQPTNSDYSSYYYYVFDIAIGAETTRVTSPWSHDVEEIYMRPRDPEEEFDDVSSRSIWFDTSGEQ